MAEKEIEINGHKFQIGKLDLSAREGAFILQQIATGRWLSNQESFALIQRRALSVCRVCSRDENGLLTIMPVQFDNGKDEPQLTPAAAFLKDDPGALWALVNHSVEVNIFPTLVGVQVRDGSTPESALALSPSNTRP